MGAPLSTPVLVVVLIVAILFLSWRTQQVQKELKALHELVDSSVTLQELQEQVLPSIDKLEEAQDHMYDLIQSLRPDMPSSHSAMSFDLAAVLSPVLSGLQAQPEDDPAEIVEIEECADRCEGLEHSDK